MNDATLATRELGPEPPMVTTREGITSWLRWYAWLGTPEEREAEVQCIMSQALPDYVAEMADRYASVSESGGGPEAMAEGMGWALSALYETHAEPHLPTCPSRGDG